LSTRHRKTTMIGDVKYFNIRHIAKRGMLPLPVIGSLCRDPRYCMITDRNEWMVKADAVLVLQRHAGDRW